MVMGSRWLILGNVGLAMLLVHVVAMDYLGMLALKVALLYVVIGMSGWAKNVTMAILLILMAALLLVLFKLAMFVLDNQQHVSQVRDKVLNL